MPEQTTPSSENGRVVPFRPHHAARWRWRGGAPASGDSPVEDLGKFEGADSEDEYRHRMRMNALALLVTVVLGTAGIWLVGKLADLRKQQDCYLSGRHNCAPINAPPVERG
jgi:hypothetical protein